MAIVGRDLDNSERKVSFQWASTPKDALVSGGVGNSLVSTAIGQSQLINMFMIPFPCTIQQYGFAAFGGLSGGVSGAVTIALNVNRFAAGTTVYLFASFAAVAFGTSGVMGGSGILAAGNTLLNLQYGDLIQMVTSGAGAMVDCVVELVVKKTQDIVAYNNVSS
jgi:hypothetical protein